jgi:outer membrane lipoprotein carrier protein
MPVPLPSLAAVLFGVMLLAAPQPPTTASPDAFAAALQQQYDTVHTLTADFTQTYTGGVLHKTITERGHVDIKKPGKMRWEYEKPEHKLFVSDGVKIYSYVPADRQVIVSSVPPNDQASTPTLFLAGKGNLTRDFNASFTTWPGAPDGAVALKLTPKHPQRDYDWLVLVVDRQTLELRILGTQDLEGGMSAISFAHLKENVDLPDRLFAFTIPPGVDVVHQTPSR